MITTKHGHVVPKKKIDIVESLVNDLRRYKAVAITKMDGIPSKQINMIRKDLNGKAKVRMAKNTFMRIALKRASKYRKNIDKLSEVIEGSAAFIFTNENPFKLNFYLQKKKAPAPAKPGDVATKDIVVPAKDTGIAPGPFISELHEVGVPTTIKGGTIHIEKDTVVAKKGDVIDETLASVLKRLDILPMEIGLPVLALYEDGMVVPEEIISKSIDEYEEEVRDAYLNAFNLSINASILTKETSPIIVSKAYIDALSLAVSANIMIPETAPMIIYKAHGQAMALALKMKEIKPEAVPEEVEIAKPVVKEEKEEVKEEKKEEEEEALGLTDLFGGQ
ncbi:MAG: 50S ribosomal protein L10 [Candidatus Asgardarchaeia archaeon]